MTPAQAVYDHWSHIFERGRYGLPGDANVKVPADQTPVVWLPGLRPELGSPGRPAVYAPS